MEPNKQEDLDMLTVIDSIKRAIINLFKSIGWLIGFSVKKIIPLSGFVIFATSISIGLYLLDKPYYKSQLTASHIRFHNDFCMELVNNLNTSINAQENNSELAKKLNISIEDAVEIRSIKYSDLNENHAKCLTDSLHDLLPFKISVEVYDTRVLDTLQKGIYYYMETNEYANKRKVIDREAIEKTSKRLELEMSELDSLKKVITQASVKGSGNTSGGITIGEPINPVVVYNRVMALYETQTLLSKKKQLNNSFEIVVGFAKNFNRSNASKLSYLLIGSLIGYVFGMIYLLGKENKSTN